MGPLSPIHCQMLSTIAKLTGLSGLEIWNLVIKTTRVSVLLLGPVHVETMALDPTFGSFTLLEPVPH
jgi:hypothetical protein